LKDEASTGNYNPYLTLNGDSDDFIAEEEFFFF